MSYCYDSWTGRYYTCNSSWRNWGRWVLLAVIIVVFLLAFFLCSCFTARRRRRAGRQPFYGTGWAAGKPPVGHGPATYNGGWTGNQQQQQQQPYYSNPEHGQAAPPYSPPANQTYYGGENQSYYNQNIELQQPSTSYQPQRGGDAVYEPPTGPPPAKRGDGVIR